MARTARQAVLTGLAGLLAGWPLLTLAADAGSYAEVQPIFQARCVSCHSTASPAAGLALDTVQGIRRGATRGPVVVPGAPARSELLKRIQGESAPRMPLSGPPWLDAGEVDRITRWIAAGAPTGTGAATAPLPPGPQSALPAPGQAVTWQHVAPVLATHCMHCHAPQGRMGPPPEGYVLTTHEAAVSAADRVRVVPGRPQASELLRRVRGHAQPRMPMDGPPWLSDEHTALIARWIADGARDAQGRPTPVPAGARIRLRGVMSADGSLDGLPLPPGGRGDKQPRPGEPMELRGTLRADGSIELERLRRR